MIKNNKIFLKIIGLIVCSFCAITNIIALFIVSKRINNKILKITSWIMLAFLVLPIIGVSIADSDSAIFTISMICMCTAILAPTFIVLFNLANYKIAYDIEETVKVRKINPLNLSINEENQIHKEGIEWVKPKYLKVAKHLYGGNGYAVLRKIDIQMNNEKNAEEKFKQEMMEKAEKNRLEELEKARIQQEKEVAEREKKEKEQREFKLAVLNAEKEKAEAEANAKALQMKREKEQQEFELAKIKAEKEKAEAEAKVLEIKRANEQVPVKQEEMKEAQTEKTIEKPKMTEKFVFISYSTKDKDIAEKTKTILENNGVSCWMAPWSIPAGSDYASEIPKALSGCGAMVLILSKSSQESKWVPKEIGIAIEYSKIIIPFQIDDELISDSFNFYLTNSQRIAAFNRMNDAYEELTKCLYSILS